MNCLIALFPSPATLSGSSSTFSLPPGGDGVAGGPDHDDVSPGDNSFLGSSFSSGSHQPGNSIDDEAGISGAGTSLALQAVYANDAVKQAFTGMVFIVRSSLADPDDNDHIWEDNMDSITFCRYYAAGHLLLAKIVQEHDQKIP